jgi:hypothetical protein
MEVVHVAVGRSMPPRGWAGRGFFKPQPKLNPWGLAPHRGRSPRSHRSAASALRTISLRPLSPIRIAAVNCDPVAIALTAAVSADCVKWHGDAPYAAQMHVVADVDRRITQIDSAVEEATRRGRTAGRDSDRGTTAQGVKSTRPLLACLANHHIILRLTPEVTFRATALWFYGLHFRVGNLLSVNPPVA